MVWITVDTLGAALAEKVDTCATLGAVVEGYGLDLACMDGAVAPSSWTGESHTRFLFPAYTAGDRRAAQYPDCGETSVLGAIREARGGAYLFGSDNSVLGDSGKDRCGLFRTVYTQGADRVWETSLLPSEIAPLPGEERPVDAAIDTFAHKVGAGGDVQIFLNFLEPEIGRAHV